MQADASKHRHTAGVPVLFCFLTLQKKKKKNQTKTTGMLCLWFLFSDAPDTSDAFKHRHTGLFSDAFKHRHTGLFSDAFEHRHTGCGARRPRWDASNPATIR
jgi:hypothetical protein